MTAHRLLERTEVSDNRLVTVAGADFKSRFLLEDFFAEYEPDAGLTDTPPVLLDIPFLLNVAPIVWASGREYVVDQMDETLFEHLETLREVLRHMYPGLAWSGRILADELVSPHVPDGADREALLFSGGLDSVFSALNHARESKQLLVTVWGADVRLSSRHGWQQVKAGTEDFAAAFNYEPAFIRSNLRECLDYSLLNALTPQAPNWWGWVQHGMGLAGLTAPLLWSGQCNRLCIASSYTAEYYQGGWGMHDREKGQYDETGRREDAWGAHPEIEGNLRWDSIEVVHDGAEYSRQEKMRSVVRQTANVGTWPGLRVCYHTQAGVNCAHCEKCYRTMIALMVLGVSATDYGFNVTDAVARERIKSALEKHSIDLSPPALVYWKEVQDELRELPRSEELDWFRDFDIDKYQERFEALEEVRQRRTAILRPAKAVARRLKRLLSRMGRS